MVRENQNNTIVFFELSCQLFVSLNYSSTSVSTHNPFFQRNFTSSVGTFFIGYFFKMVDDSKIRCIWNQIFPKTFDSVRINLVFIYFTGFVVFLKDGTISIYPDDLNI